MFLKPKRSKPTALYNWKKRKEKKELCKVLIAGLPLVLAAHRAVICEGYRPPFGPDSLGFSQDCHMHSFMPAANHEHLLSSRHPARPVWVDPPRPDGQSPAAVRNGECLDPSPHISLGKREAGVVQGSGRKPGPWSQETWVWDQVALPLTKWATLCKRFDLWCFKFLLRKKEVVMFLRGTQWGPSERWQYTFGSYKLEWLLLMPSQVK